MAETTGISWCRSTFNPWRGCTKVNSGCTNCYAESNYSVKMHGVKWGPHGTRVRLSDAGWKQPLKWNREAEKAGERHRVFCASLADVFEDWQGPILDHEQRRCAVKCDGLIKGIGRDLDKFPLSDWRWATMDDLRRDLFALIDQTPWLDWLLLTKRPENIRRMWPKTPWDACRKCGTRVDDLESDERERLYQLDEHDDGWECIACHTAVSWYRSNVWIGTSISDHATADEWVPRLLWRRDLAPVRFLSCEPLLGPVDLSKWLPSTDGFVCCGSEGDPVHVDDGGRGIDWVIVGGESGHGARPCNVEWVRSIVEQCRAAGVACFVKQLGANVCMTFDEWNDLTDGGSRGSLRFVLNGSGEIEEWRPTDSKGGDPNEWPEDLRVREMPSTNHTEHAR